MNAIYQTPQSKGIPQYKFYLYSFQDPCPADCVDRLQNFYPYINVIGRLL